MNLMKLKLNRSSDSKIEPLKLAAELVAKLNDNIPVEKAYLFGSAVRNELTPDSDLDILVILKNIDKAKLAYKIVGQKLFSPMAVDWIFKDVDSFETRKDYGGVCFEAFHYGVMIYGK